MDDKKLLLKLNRRTRFTQFLVWIALLFTAAGIAAGYKNWLRIHDKAKAGLVGVEELKAELPLLAKKKNLDELLKKVAVLSEDGREHLDGALKELRGIQDSTQHLANSVYAQVETLTVQQEATSQIHPATIQDWSLAEVHFLLQTAKQMLDLNHDKRSSIMAFNLADQLLLKRGSAQLLPLRKQIGNDIALVKQYALPDVSALSNKIDYLLAQLKPIKKAPKEKAVKPKELTDLNKNETESIVNRVKKTLNDAVVIKKFDKPLQDEMDDLSKDSLYQLLSLRFETLRMMLLQGRDDSYHGQIERIKQLLKTYYPVTKYSVFEKQLNEMNAVDLAPAVPDISGSIKLLKSMMKNGEKGK